jgi:hypothetical protein
MDLSIFSRKNLKTASVFPGSMDETISLSVSSLGCFLVLS